MWRKYICNPIYENNKNSIKMHNKLCINISDSKAEYLNITLKYLDLELDI